jgi:hypothetical protein
MSVWRSRWAAIGAAVAVSLGAGGLGLAQAAIGSGEKPVTVTIAPQRILDTRTNLGLTGQFVDETPRDLQVTGSVPVASGGSTTVVPSDAVAVLVNTTVVTPSSKGYLSLRPAGAAGIPTTSTVNFTAGSIEPNAATVDLGPGGRVQVFLNTDAAGGTAHVLLDVVGYTVDHTHDDRYYTEGETENRFMSTIEDTFYYVPGSLLQTHWLDGPAEVYFDNSSDAVVRKTTAAGRMKVLIPVSLPSELGGKWGKLVNFRVSYKVDNPSSYIDHIWLTKSDNSGGHVIIGQSSTDLTSTTYTSHVVDCSDPGCQLSWVPNGNYLTVLIELNYTGTGDPHDITIGGVLMRVSYDG